MRQRKGVLTPSKMYLLLIRNTAVESEGDAGQEARKRDLCVHECVRMRVCVFAGRRERTAEVQKSLQPDTLHFSSHNLRMKTCKASTCQHPSAVSLTDCSWLLFSQDKNQEMQKLNRI